MHGPDPTDTPVPAPERTHAPIPRPTARVSADPIIPAPPYRPTYAVPGTLGTEVRWVRTLAGDLRVEVLDPTRDPAVYTLEELNRAADRDPGGWAHRVLRAVEGGAVARRAGGAR